MTQEQIDELAKVKNEVAKEKGFPSWMEMENWIIDNNLPVSVAVLLMGAMNDVCKKLIAGYAAAPAYDGVVSEYQLCPKCNGDGNLARYNSPSMVSTDAALICDVCNGAKTLIKPVVFPAAPAYKGDEKLAIDLVDWIANVKEEGDTIMISDGDYYWGIDIEGGHPMNGKDLLKMYLESIATPTQPNSVQQNKNNNNEMD